MYWILVDMGSICWMWPETRTHTLHIQEHALYGHTAHKIIKVLIDSSCNQIKNSIFVNFFHFCFYLYRRRFQAYTFPCVSRASLHWMPWTSRLVSLSSWSPFDLASSAFDDDGDVTKRASSSTLLRCFFLWVLGSLFLVYGWVCARFVIFVDNHQLINLPLLSLNLHIHRQYGGTQTTGKEELTTRFSFCKDYVQKKKCAFATYTNGLIHVN